MKYRYRILLLTDSDDRPQFMGLNWDDIDFFPGSRSKNYLELLTGFGIPFEVKDIKTLRYENILSQDTLLFSTVLFACPINNIPSEHLSMFDKLSRDHGLSLVADAFLFSGKRFLAPFGIKKCSGLKIGTQNIKDESGSTLYRTKLYPHSAKGFDIGVRPLLRLIIQNWFSKRTTAEQTITSVASRNNRDSVICSFRFGKATNIFLNVHPSLILFQGNLFHGTLAEVIERSTQCPSASLKLSNIACLRMDDPGSSERVHLEGFNPGVLSHEDWELLIEILKDNDAHLNIAYVPQWVDDGNAAKGSLACRGEAVTDRKPGEHYKSWEISYSKQNSQNSHDHASEYQAIKKGVEEGVLTILSHGLTHLTTEVDAWLKSNDKYTEMEWYREFKERVTHRQPADQLLIERMREGSSLIKEAFGIQPRILVPSAHEHTTATAGLARTAGFNIFSSRATYLLWKDKIVTNRKIKASYPELLIDAISYSMAGYPVVFVFHDYDIYRNGSSWLTEQISTMKKNGIQRFPSMEVLGCLLLARMEVVSEENEALRITIDFSDTIDSGKLKGDIPIRIHADIADITVNGESYAGEIAVTDNIAYFSIPFSKIDKSILTLSVTLTEDVASGET